MTLTRPRRRSRATRRAGTQLTLILTLALTLTLTLNPNPNPDKACRQRIAERRAIFEQSRTTTSRQNMMDLSRQRAALYNTTYQGAACIPGIPCL